MNKSILKLTLLIIVLIPSITFGQSWQLVYENDKDGSALNGSKQELIESVRNGKSVRVIWRMGGGKNIVEHSAEAQFLTIMNGEVFAQITEINAQRPDFNSTSMDFLGRHVAWSMISSTTGNNATMLYDKNNLEKEYKKMESWGTKWYVKD